MEAGLVSSVHIIQGTLCTRYAFTVPICRSYTLPVPCAPCAVYDIHTLYTEYDIHTLYTVYITRTVYIVHHVLCTIYIHCTPCTVYTQCHVPCREGVSQGEGQAQGERLFPGPVCKLTGGGPL